MPRQLGRQSWQLRGQSWQLGGQSWQLGGRSWRQAASSSRECVEPPLLGAADHAHRLHEVAHAVVAARGHLAHLQSTVRCLLLSRILTMQSVNWSMSSSHSLPHSSARLLTSSSQPPEQELVTEKILAGSLGQEGRRRGRLACVSSGGDQAASARRRRLGQAASPPGTQGRQDTGGELLVWPSWR